MQDRKVMALSTVRLSTTKTQEFLLSEYLKDNSEDGSMALTILLLKRENLGNANTKRNTSQNHTKNECDERDYVIQTLYYPLSYHTVEQGTNQSRGKK